MKLLLGCRERKPYLCLHRIETGLNKLGYVDLGYALTKEDKYKDIGLNGKIVGECEYELEEIKLTPSLYDKETYLNEKEILKNSCLTYRQLADCIGKGGYAIHIKNLKIYDKPRELNTCSNYIPVKSADGYCYYNPELKKCPKKMMYVWHFYDKTDNPELSYRILLPLTSKELCNIFNGRQTVIVKRNVLKEMI